MTDAATLQSRLTRGTVYDVQGLAAILHGLPLESFSQLSNGALLLTFVDGSEAYVDLECGEVRTRGKPDPSTP